MQLPAGIAQVLGRRFDGVARIALRHERCRAFRWFSLVEVTLGVFVVLCIVPLLLVVSLFGDGYQGDLPSIRVRFYRYWHDLVLTVLGPQGHVMAEVRHTPASEGEGQGIVAAVLDAAQREAAVVVESIGNDQSSAGEVCEVWYGGRPLLAPPHGRPEAQAAALLQRAGLVVEQSPEGVVLREPGPPPNRIVAFFVFFFVIIPLSPILLLMKRGRFALRESWDSVRGIAATERVITVRAESITTELVRGSRRWDKQLVDGADLLGITFSPYLGFDREVTRRDATLRCVGRRSSATVRLRRASELGVAVRDLMVAATLRVRQARPELGLLGPGPRPTRCPYCSGLYDMQPGAQCPYCGAPAGQVG